MTTVINKNTHAKLYFFRIKYLKSKVTTETWVWRNCRVSFFTTAPSKSVVRVFSALMINEFSTFVVLCICLVLFWSYYYKHKDFNITYKLFNLVLINTTGVKILGAWPFIYNIKICDVHILMQRRLYQINGTFNSKPPRSPFISTFWVPAVIWRQTSITIGRHKTATVCVALFGSINVPDSETFV